jgi:hypothetical protein
MADSIDIQLKTLVEEAVKTATASQNAVLTDIARMVRELKPVAQEPTSTPIPSNPNPPVQPPPTQADDGPGTRSTTKLRWRSINWTVVDGKVLKDGQSTPDVAMTGNVESIEISPENLLRQTNLAGDVFDYSGQSHWSYVGKVKRPSLNADVRLPETGA